jgi:hypothetical protein
VARNVHRPVEHGRERDEAREEYRRRKLNYGPVARSSDVTQKLASLAVQESAFSEKTPPAIAA